MKKIKILAMDVDGTLTDGKLYISENGELFKAFDIKDGFGIKNLLITSGIVPVVITGRKSKIVENRAKELDIVELYQGISDKLVVINQLVDKYNVSYDEIAFIGDDCNDLSVIRAVGLSFAPADCTDEIRKEVDVVLSKGGGNGAVRECICHILTRNAEYDYLLNS